MYSKEQIDREAEREANALRRQGRCENTNERHNRIAADYNQAEFEKLFRPGYRI